MKLTSELAQKKGVGKRDTRNRPPVLTKLQPSNKW